MNPILPFAEFWHHFVKKIDHKLLSEMTYYLKFHNLDIKLCVKTINNKVLSFLITNYLSFSFYFKFELNPLSRDIHILYTD